MVQLRKGNDRTGREPVLPSTHSSISDIFSGPDFFHQHSDFSHMCPERKSTNSSLNIDKHVKLFDCLCHKQYGQLIPTYTLPTCPAGITVFGVGPERI